MNNTDKIEVALVKEACPLCGKTKDGPIIINTRITKPMAEKVKALHGKTIGYMEEPCNSCKDLMKQGFLLIGVVEKKSESNDPYRSGNQWVIKRKAAKRMFSLEKLERGAAFISTEAALKIGLPDVNVNA